MAECIEKYPAQYSSGWQLQAATRHRWNSWTLPFWGKRSGNSSIESTPTPARMEKWYVASGKGHRLKPMKSIELDREIYHPEVMNRQLYGEPLPGEEIDPEIIEAIRAAGTVSVETCEDARGFLEIKQDVIESQPYVPEHDAGTGTDSPLPGAVFDEASPAPDTIDKVIDGQTYNNPPTVAVRVWSSAGTGLASCTGTLIGPNHLLTAAHCFDTGGFFRVSVVSQGGASCVSRLQPTAGDCITAPTGSNAFVTIPAGYSGDGDWAQDMAIVQATAGAWLAPANTSTSWMRITNMAGSISGNYWVSGYGDNTWNGLGYGTGRLALQAQAVDWSGSGTWYTERDAFGVGAPCTGDSGGPAIHTSFGFDMIFGVQVSTERYAGHACPSVEGEHRFRYVNPGKAGAWIQSTVAAAGGLCTDFQHTIWNYLRCW